MVLQEGTIVKNSLDLIFIVRGMELSTSFEIELR
jgi:hypothetical protein